MQWFDHKDEGLLRGWRSIHDGRVTLHVQLVGTGPGDWVRHSFHPQGRFSELAGWEKPAEPTFEGAMQTEKVVDAVLQSAVGKWEKASWYTLAKFGRSQNSESEPEFRMGSSSGPVFVRVVANPAALTQELVPTAEVILRKPTRRYAHADTFLPRVRLASEVWRMLPSQDYASRGSSIPTAEVIPQTPTRRYAHTFLPRAEADLAYDAGGPSTMGRPAAIGPAALVGVFVSPQTNI